MNLFCVTVLVSILTYTQAVMFKDCGSTTCKIDSVDVSGCAATAQTCNLARGQTVNMTLKFTPSREVKELENRFQGEVDGAWVPFKKEDACSSTTPKCPVSSGTDATYDFSLSVSKLYPTIAVIAESKMTDDSGAVCTCFKIQVKIV